MTHVLSQQQIDRYHADGYLIVEGVLDDVMRQRMKNVLAELVEKSRAVASHDDIYDLEPGHTKEEPRVRRIKKPHEIDPVFKDFMYTPKLVGILQDLLGESVRLHGSKLNLKAPHFGSPVEWHQDWAFYPHTNDDVLATGILLDDCSEVNGPLLVIPGSQRGRMFDHHSDGVFCGAITGELNQIEFGKAVPLTGKAGDMSIHHARSLHGSAQNRSDKQRRLLLFEYTAADAFPLSGVADFAEFNSRIVLGSPTVEPRLRPAPVRMPLPPAKSQGSIYENQRGAKVKYFDTVAAK